MLDLFIGVLLLSGRGFASPTPGVAVLDDTDLDTSLIDFGVSGIVKFDDNGTIIEHQMFNLGTALMKRDDIPPECEFVTNPGGGPQLNYRYNQLVFPAKPFLGKKGSGCIAWTTGTTYETWGNAARDYIIDSMGKQIKKDGFFKTSSAGKWHARFDQTSTTAFADNDIRPFSTGIKYLFANPDTQRAQGIKHALHYVCIMKHMLNSPLLLTLHAPYSFTPDTSLAKVLTKLRHHTLDSDNPRR